MARPVPLALVLLVLAGCGGGPVVTDAGAGDGGPRQCTADDQCDDGVFCNGAERCMPGAAGANGRGCVAAAGGPCPTGMLCEEVAARCSVCPPAMRDLDGDGHRALACGGDDCDDADPNRYPGNPETCDTLGHDEDCDPTTYGRRDLDRDGYVDAICCDGTTCGDDCDDLDPSVHPTATEVCNHYDDNCNGMIDEGVLIAFFTDFDNDSYGAAAAGMGCTVLSGNATRGGDCDDMDASRHPGATEACNALDDDCNGMTDEGTASVCAAALGNHGPAVCVPGPGGPGATCRPADCAMGFADCDGDASNGCESDTCNDGMECNHCGGHCLCVGGGCIGLTPTLGFGGWLHDSSGAAVSGATIRPLFGCQSESAMTDASGMFTLTMHVTPSSRYRVDVPGSRTNVVGGGTLDVIAPSDLGAWLADPDVPADDPSYGIVVLDLTTDFPFQLSAPAGPPQVVMGTDVLPAGTGASTLRVVFFHVAPGPITASPVVPLGCSVTCPAVSSWVIAGGVTHLVVSSACSEMCA